ncbi:MAG: hypothetical protein RDU14_12745 [Melioribacteraceae bacterium]|nr:hypothetical protein [Melioribacteraceae bacterium]
MFSRRALIIFIIILSPKLLFTQTYLGFRIDPLIYATSVEKVKYGPEESETNSLKVKVSIIPKISFTTSLSERLKLNARAGIVLGSIFETEIFDRLYRGIEGSLLINYNYDPKQYLIFGINAHMQAEFGGNTYSGNSVFVPYVVLGFGVFTSQNFSLELQFNLPLKKEVYGIYRGFESVTYYSIRHFYNVAAMLNMSFGFDCEL